MSGANKTQVDVDMDEDQVADYLQSHPDFFERHQNLLTTIRIPHRTGGAVSLVERQVSSLRKKNLQLERKLRDLLEVAESNDQLAGKVHKLATRLLAAGTRAQAVGVAEELLRSSFNAENAVLVLFESNMVGEFDTESRFLRLVEKNDPAMSPFRTFIEGATARCGLIRDAQRDFLFGPDAEEVGSAALVPLGENVSTGFLAIGSRDAEYFHPGKSMDFLSRLGDLLGCALAIR
ncbi:MAG: DUF484 family protein [Gammaproteobacteria bacterium]